MRSLTEVDGTLVVQGPTWLGLVLIGIGVVVAIAALALYRRVRREVRLGMFLGTIVMLWAGWHLISARITFEPRGYVVESIYGEEDRMGWLQVREIVTSSRFDGPDILVLGLRNSNEARIDLSGLSAEEKARIVAYVRKRLSR